MTKLTIVVKSPLIIKKGPQAIGEPIVIPDDVHIIGLSPPYAFIGSVEACAGVENYFYVRPGGDASIVVQAAVDYVEELQRSGETADKEE